METGLFFVLLSTMSCGVQEYHLQCDFQIILIVLIYVTIAGNSYIFVAL